MRAAPASLKVQTLVKLHATPGEQPAQTVPPALSGWGWSGAAFLPGASCWTGQEARSLQGVDLVLTARQGNSPTPKAKHSILSHMLS